VLYAPKSPEPAGTKLGDLSGITTGGGGPACVPLVTSVPAIGTGGAGSVRTIGTAPGMLGTGAGRAAPRPLAVPAGLGIVQGDGKIPYTTEALKLRDENRAKAVELDPEVKCYLPGIPRANYMDKPFQIFHSDKAVFFAYEYAGAVRNVFLEDPGEAPVDSWMGQSYGKWNGDTFEITVTGLLGDTWLDRSGNLHGSTTKVVERWTPTSDYTMRYEATITDEEVYTKPWTIAFNLYKRQGEDAQLQQFKCVEFVEELMYGHLRKAPLPGPALDRAKREAEARAKGE